MSKRGEVVARPLRKDEYKLQFGSKSAATGWRSLLATQRNTVVDAWEELTTQPHRLSQACHPLKAQLSTVTHHGEVHEQWQYELTGGARIWFYVSDQVVCLVQVHTRHPNQTKNRGRG